MSKYLNLITYFGGKFPHLSWLIDQFPKGHYHFIDLMCGSANVALNVDYPLITINDINEEVVNLFYCLREHEEELTRAIYFTPYSRKELNSIITDSIEGKRYSPVERARRYFVKSQLGYGANGSQNNHYGTSFEWQIQRTKFYRVDNWNLRLKKLAIIAEKLRGMQIESRDALDLFDSVDKENNIIYIDPPYRMENRSCKKRYLHEVDESFHDKIALKAVKARAFVAISGYDSKRYDELFAGFYKISAKVSTCNTANVERRECLWTNYDPTNLK